MEGARISWGRLGRVKGDGSDEEAAAVVGEADEVSRKAAILSNVLGRIDSRLAWPYGAVLECVIGGRARGAAGGGGAEDVP